MNSNRHTNPIRLIRNIRRLLSAKENSKSSIKVSSKAQRTYWLPCLKNTILVIIAITLAEMFRINEIARCLPICVSDKQKQKRLLRFLSRGYPTESVMKRWALFVLRKVYATTKSKVLLLIDETDLLFGYKAIVVAIPFRMRAIPIYWKIYQNEQIQDMVYLSHNTLIWNFLLKLKKLQHQALGKRRHFVWIFDRGFADVKLMIKLKEWKVGFIIRVCRNVGVEVEGYVGKLSSFPRRGYFENIVYHKEKRIRVNLYCAWDDNYDEPMLLVSNQAYNLLMLYSQRMKIEEAFRDLKSLFGFRSLVLKDDCQQRVELLWLMCVMSMGLSFLLYEKSGYRWAKQKNDNHKRFSLINVIKQMLKERFKSFRLKPSFSLPLCEADIVSI
jgi:hypothetical protein